MPKHINLTEEDRVLLHDRGGNDMPRLERRNMRRHEPIDAAVMAECTKRAGFGMSPIDRVLWDASERGDYR